MLRDKKKLIEEIGMKFDEAMELFSDETLESMTMVNIVGGADTNTYCGGAQCVEGCNNHCHGCGSSNPGNSSNSSNSNSNSGTHIGNPSNSNSTNNGTNITVPVYLNIACRIQAFC